MAGDANKQQGSIKAVYNKRVSGINIEKTGRINGLIITNNNIFVLYVFLFTAYVYKVYSEKEFYYIFVPVFSNYTDIFSSFMSNL
jgi:hypothetical protein